MHRRQLLKVGLFAGALLTVAGGAAWWLVNTQARSGDRFQPATRNLFLVVGSVVLAGSLPEAESARHQALQAWLAGLEITVAGMPFAVQNELDEMVLILLNPLGRVGLAGLRQPWESATTAQVQEAMQGLRLSTVAVRQQIFHALRDLCNAAYFAAPLSWAALGYPGPLKV